LKIGIDAKNLCGPLSGISRYVMSMVVHLADRGVQLVLFAPRPLTAKQLIHPNITLVTSNLHGRMGNLVWSQVVLPNRIKRHKIDVFWGPAHRLPAFPAHIPKVLTIHDFVWKKHPETMSRLGLLGEKLLMPGALKRADRIVCLSQFTLSDLVREHVRAKDIAHTIYPGTTTYQAQPSANNPFANGPAYMLFVGTHEPRKNLEGLLRAYAALSPEQMHQCHLRIIGAAGWKQDHLKTLARELGLSDYVHWAGFVDDDTLEQAYENARFHVLPSIFEGFGLPIIEAQKYGKPVVTSNCSSMPEVVGEGGLLVDPNSTQSITRGLAKLIDDPHLCAQLGDKARLNAARFDWQTSAHDFEIMCRDLLAEKGKAVESSAFLQNS
jgi:glycosyltransferase involved in cell wall biosynthesis